MIELNYGGSVPKYMQVKNSLKLLLDSNAFLQGESLPPVNIMSSRLAINPRNLQWAYDELVKEGYIIYKDGEYLVAEKVE